MSKPKYLSAAVHDPVIATADGAGRYGNQIRVRWQCISKRTGKTIIASEWIPYSKSGVAWVEEKIKEIINERRELGVN